MVFLEGALLLLLLLVVPWSAQAQLKLMDPADLRRIPAYLESMVAIGVLGALGLWLGTWRWGLAGLGLAAPASWSVVLLQAALLAGTSVAITEGLDRWRARRGESESAWVLALLPVTLREKWVFAGLSVMAGVGEEIAYRGFAFQLLALWTGSPLIAGVVTAMAFGWVHAYQGTFGRIRAGLLGVVLTLPVWLGWGLWPSILAHTMIDWIGGLLLGERWTRRAAERTGVEWRST
ncbi:MAG: CPBP family intramembrane glutamic endopeptidase [Gemmatimonadota bacterium]